MTTIEVLEKARARIAKGWTQGKAFRLDDAGREVAWCASGAILHVTGDMAAPCTGCAALNWIERANGDARVRGLSVWNDTQGRTQQEVLAVFDRAIALALDPTP